MNSVETEPTYKPVRRARNQLSDGRFVLDDIRRSLAGAGHEQDGQVANVLHALVDIGKDLVCREAKDARDKLVIEFGEGRRRDHQEAVAGGEGDTCELGFSRCRTDGTGVLFIGEVGCDAAGVVVERHRRAGLRDDRLIAATAETTETDAHAVLGDALAVPIGQVAVRVSKQTPERASEAHIQASERVADGGDDVAGERLTRGRGAFGKDEQFRAVVGGTFAVEDPGVGSPVDRFVIDDRELANLEWLGQRRPSFCYQDWTRGNSVGTARQQNWQAPASTEQSLYHRVLGVEQPIVHGVTRGFAGFWGANP